MALAWNQVTMTTGVAEIDAQHKELIVRLNELFDRMQKGEGADALKGVLDFLANYATWHFSREEKCMDIVQCSVAAANKQAHAAFLETFTRLRKRFETEGPTTKLVLETQRELSGWLTTHICKVDTRLRDCIAKAS
ncbi:MAG TPA: bacteriohemerythrin [Vicinamibacterales bacterium]|nr:bacteriohemerythrin [Vicinamibacterales bacterium]